MSGVRVMIPIKFLRNLEGGIVSARLIAAFSFTAGDDCSC